MRDPAPFGIRQHAIVLPPPVREGVRYAFAQLIREHREISGTRRTVQLFVAGSESAHISLTPCARMLYCADKLHNWSAFGSVSFFARTGARSKCFGRIGVDNLCVLGHIGHMPQSRKRVVIPHRRCSLAKSARPTAYNPFSQRVGFPDPPTPANFSRQR